MAIPFYRGDAAHYFSGVVRTCTRIFVAYFRGDRLRTHVLTLLYSGLAGISVKIIATLWLYAAWNSENRPADEQVSEPSVHQGAPLDKSPWQSVYEQTWFGQHQLAAPGPTASVAETKLHLVLRGIAYGANPAAVIEESGQQNMYRQGDALAAYPATVGEIFRDHLLLYYQGETERLSLADSETDSNFQAQITADKAAVNYNNNPGDLFP
ncbi:type II secretion system protein N [Vagococcus sp. WN89Y]|uniref:type II secretion system protein N n=1 Tax=Vagococcus sp. WN89Y TaxID=3457258 RepID=UPI003FCD6759